MARARFRRKTLKRPDEFVSRGTNAVEWARTHKRRVAQIAGVIAALGLVAFAVTSLRSARVRQANADLSHGISSYRAGRYSEAAAQLTEVASEWASSNPGRIARLYAANADLRASNLESAGQLLQDTVSTADWPSYLRQQALFLSAGVLERKGDAPAAAARYAEAVAVEGPYTALALAGEARTRAKVGEREAARRLYERLAREFPSPGDADYVAAKAAGLSG